MSRLAEVQVLGLVGVLSLYAGSLRSTETVNRPFLGAVLREHCQAFAMKIQVYQREAGTQPVVVFRHTSVAHLVEAEDAFQDAERVLYLGTHTRLTFILFLL